MSSGFGNQGGRGRCFPLWQEFLKCYSQLDVPGGCKYQAEDYYECLHGFKERRRAMRIGEIEEAKIRGKSAPQVKVAYSLGVVDP